MRADGILVGLPHAGNSYFVAVEHAVVIEMISLCRVPPFSVAKRLPPNLRLHEVAPRPYEVHLLAIRLDAVRQRLRISRGHVGRSCSPLYAALEERCPDEHRVQEGFAHYAPFGEYVREALGFRGFTPVANNTAFPPPITSFAAPSPTAMRRCHDAGFRVAHENEYLQRQGWAQISVMGELSEAEIAPVFDLFGAPLRGETTPGVSG